MRLTMIYVGILLVVLPILFAARLWLSMQKYGGLPVSWELLENSPAIIGLAMMITGVLLIGGAWISLRRSRRSEFSN